MSTNATQRPRRIQPGMYSLLTIDGEVIIAGNLRINGTAASWGYTAPDGDTIVEWGFGTLAEAADHAMGSVQ